MNVPARRTCIVAAIVALALIPAIAAGLDEAYRLYKKAESKVDAGDYDGALDLVERAIQRHPDSGVFRAGIQQRHYFPYYLRGLVRLRMQDSEGAKTDFEHELGLGEIQKDRRLHSQLLAAQQEAESVDTGVPVVHVDDVQLVDFDTVERDGVEIEQVTLRLTGSAIDLGSGISSMQIAGQEATLVPEDGSYRFDATVLLPSSLDAVDIVAVDAAGNVGKSRQIVDIPPLDLGAAAERIHAVIVGVNAYDQSYRTPDGNCRREVRSACDDDRSFACYNLQNLSFAANDAQRFGDLLRRRGVPEENIHLLTSVEGDLRATTDGVRNALARLEAAEGDTAIFYFSGHGVSSRRQENLMLMSDTRGYECSGEDDQATDLEQSAVGVTEVAASMMRSGAEERYIILDACRSPRLVTKGSGGAEPSAGFSVAGIKGIGGLAPTESADAGLEPIVFYSTLEKKVSIEWNKKSSGYFTYFLLQGLRRDLPLDELKRYVQQSVKDQTMDDLCSAEQQDCPYLQAPYLQLPKALEQDYDLQSRMFILGGDS